MGETDNLEINPGTEENGFGITQPAQQPERWTFTLQEVAALADQYDGMEDPLEREAASALFNEVWRNREAFMEYERQVELRTTEAMLGDPDTLAGEWSEELELASTLLHTDRNQARKRHANTRRLSALYNIPFHDMEPMQDIILALHMNRAGESVSDEEGYEFLKKEVAQSPMAGKQDNLPGHVEIINGKKVRVLNPIVFTEPLSKKELRRQERMEKHGDVEMPFWGKVFMGASTPIKVMFGWAVKHDAESMQEFAQSFMLPGSNIEVTPEQEVEGYKQMFTTVEGVSALGMGLAMGAATPGIARGAMPKKGRVPKTAVVAAEQNAKLSILPGHKINEPLVVGPHIGDGVVLIVPEKEAALQGAKPLNPGQYRIQPQESGYALLDHEGQTVGSFATTDDALSAGMDAVSMQGKGNFLKKQKTHLSDSEQFAEKGNPKPVNEETQGNTRNTVIPDQIRLDEHESVGGHTISRHIGKTDDELVRRFSEKKRLNKSSTFRSQKEAELLIYKAFEMNQPRIEMWINSGARGRLIFELPVKDVGKIAQKNSQSIISGSKVKVVLQGDGKGNYYILTGYPSL